MARTRRQLEDQVVRYAHELHARGWVANHDGNITVRIADGRVLSTATAISKADDARTNLIVVDDEGKVVSGSRNPFGEVALHLYVYRHRPDVGAVVHSHAPHATALAVAGVPVEPRMLAESVVSLGTEIPLIPYAAPKSPEWTTNLQAAVAAVDAVTLANHGVLTWGPDLETAYLRMELVEHLARIQMLAGQVGGARLIPEDGVPALLASRAKAGLGPEGRQIQRRELVATEQAEAVAKVVREEVSRVLRTR